MKLLVLTALVAGCWGEAVDLVWDHSEWHPILAPCPSCRQGRVLLPQASVQPKTVIRPPPTIETNIAQDTPAGQFRSPAYPKPIKSIKPGLVKANVVPISINPAPTFQQAQPGTTLLTTTTHTVQDQPATHSGHVQPNTKSGHTQFATQNGRVQPTIPIGQVLTNTQNGRTQHTTQNGRVQLVYLPQGSIRQLNSANAARIIPTPPAKQQQEEGIHQQLKSANAARIIPTPPEKQQQEEGVQDAPPPPAPQTVQNIDFSDKQKRDHEGRVIPGGNSRSPLPMSLITAQGQEEDAQQKLLLLEEALASIDQNDVNQLENGRLPRVFIAPSHVPPPRGYVKIPLVPSGGRTLQSEQNGEPQFPSTFLTPNDHNPPPGFVKFDLSSAVSQLSHDIPVVVPNSQVQPNLNLGVPHFGHTTPGPIRPDAALNFQTEDARTGKDLRPLSPDVQVISKGQPKPLSQSPSQFVKQTTPEPNIIPPSSFKPSPRPPRPPPPPPPRSPSLTSQFLSFNPRHPTPLSQQFLQDSNQPHFPVTGRPPFNRFSEQSQSSPNILQSGQTFSKPGQPIPTSSQTFSQSNEPFPQPGQSLPQPHQSFNRPGHTPQKSGQPLSQPRVPLPQSGQSFPQSGHSFPQSSQSFPQPSQSFPQPGQSFPQSGQSFSQPGQPFSQSNQKPPLPRIPLSQPVRPFSIVGQSVIPTQQQFPQPPQPFPPQPGRPFPSQPNQQFRRPSQSNGGSNQFRQHIPNQTPINSNPNQSIFRNPQLIGRPDFPDINSFNPQNPPNFRPLVNRPQNSQHRPPPPPPPQFSAVPVTTTTLRPETFRPTTIPSTTLAPFTSSQPNPKSIESTPRPQLLSRPSTKPFPSSTPRPFSPQFSPRPITQRFPPRPTPPPFATSPLTTLSTPLIRDPPVTPSPKITRRPLVSFTSPDSTPRTSSFSPFTHSHSSTSQSQGTPVPISPVSQSTLSPNTVSTPRPLISTPQRPITSSSSRPLLSSSSSPIISTTPRLTTISSPRPRISFSQRPNSFNTRPRPTPSSPFITSPRPPSPQIPNFQDPRPLIPNFQETNLSPTSFEQFDGSETLLPQDFFTTPISALEEPQSAKTPTFQRPQGSRTHLFPRPQESPRLPSFPSFQQPAVTTIGPEEEDQTVPLVTEDESFEFLTPAPTTPAPTTPAPTTTVKVTTFKPKFNFNLGSRRPFIRRKPRPDEPAKKDGEKKTESATLFPPFSVARTLNPLRVGNTESGERSSISEDGVTIPPRGAFGRRLRPRTKPTSARSDAAEPQTPIESISSRARDVAGSRNRENPITRTRELPGWLKSRRRIRGRGRFRGAVSTTEDPLIVDTVLEEDIPVDILENNSFSGAESTLVIFSRPLENDVKPLNIQDTQKADKEEEEEKFTDIINEDVKNKDEETLIAAGKAFVSLADKIANKDSHDEPAYTLEEYVGASPEPEHGESKSLESLAFSTATEVQAEPHRSSEEFLQEYDNEAAVAEPEPEPESIPHHFTERITELRLL